jgi:SNF2 family DNA or RNA helicase
MEGDEKLVVYCHHRDVVARIQGAVGGAVITGDTSQQGRADVIKAFQNECLPRIVTITSAGGQGIDLFGIGGIKSRVIMMVERAWTPSEEEQAEARLHRLGQANPVNAYYLLAEGTIDERMNRLIEKKRSVIGGIHALFAVEQNIVGDLIKDYLGG